MTLNMILANRLHILTENTFFLRPKRQTMDFQTKGTTAGPMSKVKYDV